jgi:hypothetical protein
MRGRRVALGLLTLSLIACTGQSAVAPRSSAPVPDTLRVTCMADGSTRLGSDRVRTQVDGVHLQVMDRSGHDGTYLELRDGRGVTRVDRASEYPAWVVATGTGTVEVTCTPEAFDPTDGLHGDGRDVRTFTVVDPGRHWTTPTTAQDLGCTSDGALYPLPPVPGRTEAEALDGAVAANYPSGTRTYEVRQRTGGYDTGSSYSFVLVRNGSAAATGHVVPTADEGWEAQIDGTCAERLDEPVDRPPFPTPTPDGPPTTLRVTCTSEGATVADPQVRTSPNGVRLEVDDRTGRTGGFFVFGGTPEEASGDRWTEPYFTPLQMGTGRWYVGCSRTDDAGDAALATVTVVDPDHSWREPRMRTDCRPTGAYFSITQGRGPTEQAALVDMLDQVPEWKGARIRLYDDGYWRRPGHTFVVLHRQHGEFTDGAVSPSPDGGWVTGLSGTCDPDRLPSA